MGLNKHVQNMAFDVRLLDWNLKYGVISNQEIKKHKDNLPDDKEKIVAIRIEEISHGNGAISDQH